MFKINSFGISDVGLVRRKNEDAFALKPGMGFWALADGMGGEDRGEVASQIFTNTAVEVFSGYVGQSREDDYQLVQRTFGLANERILRWAKENQVQKMGCTAELLALRDPDYVLGHVGDSRTYRFRQGQLRQLTRDHSLVQEQVDRGLLTPAKAHKNALRNIILRAVGVEETLAVDLLRGQCLIGDLYLLCSDGLTTMVEDKDIQELLRLPLSLEQKVDRLVQTANSAGGTDNITVVLCEITES